MHNTLNDIIAYKREIISRDKRHVLQSEYDAVARTLPPTRGFANALQGAVDRGDVALIAELKKASPSKGVIRDDFDPSTLASAYETGGAACLSVLTDEHYFQGENDYLVQARAAVALPVLRKDFMVDPYQIIQSRALGADCILLIVAALSDAQLQELEACALEYGMDVLVETHDLDEIERAQHCCSSPLLGINNRNLKTLAVDIETSIALKPYINADKLAVCESGISSYEDVEYMREHGMHCFLVGESLMRHDNIEHATRILTGK